MHGIIISCNSSLTYTIPFFLLLFKLSSINKDYLILATTSPNPPKRSVFELVI